MKDSQRKILNAESQRRKMSARLLLPPPQGDLCKCAPGRPLPKVLIKRSSSADVEVKDTDVLKAQPAKGADPSERTMHSWAPHLL